MARKPNVEFRIICSGKGGPWHTAGYHQVHTHKKRSMDAAAKDANVLNEEAGPTPVAAECQPWRIETRTITNWE